MVMDESVLTSPSDVLGRVLAERYELVSLLGVGSSGAIYRARDRVGERDVALKVLHPELAEDAEALARFEREARAASLLRHPGVVELLDVGRDEGLHYIALELVEGEGLDERLAREGPVLELEPLVELAGQVCAALGAAHRVGIVHRDLKPANVLVFRDEAGRVRVKLCDFGMAALHPGLEPGRRERLTARGQLVGTPAYLAPERARGEALDARCDIYALGVVLYEMTTARLPFADDSPLAVLAQHLTRPPPPPSSLVPDYPPRLERIVLRCLAKDPAARFADADALHDALRELLRPEPEAAAAAAVTVPDPDEADEAVTDARTPASTAAAEQPRRRATVLVAAAVALVVAALVVLLFAG